MKPCSSDGVLYEMMPVSYTHLDVYKRQVYAAGETAVVATDVLNVRSGAGTNYSRIGALKEGRTFVVTGSAKDSSGVVLSLIHI